MNPGEYDDLKRRIAAAGLFATAAFQEYQAMRRTILGEKPRVKYTFDRIDFDDDIFLFTGEEPWDGGDVYTFKMPVNALWNRHWINDETNKAHKQAAHNATSESERQLRILEEERKEYERLKAKFGAT